ncbi:Uncaracterized surface protein containing fasciclin (FAS1) repeats [Parapedobacter composti]|uniref:Uncaracterized surface protein containing fasciclin (FAS1) repeats n=2 Tax=Parapedobacter composti TaxID=623281 RepID=A0A1I1M078_9SPHI|nr:Uncaracterized surface protein containing fasciclin (FAS1) repeats [Parapedobacter composti]
MSRAYTRCFRCVLIFLHVMIVFQSCTKEDPPVNSIHNARGIAAVANNNYSLQYFFLALQVTNYVPLLTEPGPFTVFAPANEAFNSLGVDARGAIQSNAALVGQIIPYHIYPGVLKLDDLGEGRNQVFTMQNEMTAYVSHMKNDRESLVTINGVPVQPKGFEASNGLVYTTQALLQPTQQLTLAELISNDASFTFFSVALQHSGLADLLEESGELTVFAPMNSAFEARGIFTTDEIKSMSPDELKPLVLSHIAEGRQYLYDYIMMADVTTQRYTETMLDGKEASIQLLPNYSWISQTGFRGISISKPDNSGGLNTSEILIESHIGRTANNGVLHGISTVLRP